MRGLLVALMALLGAPPCPAIAHQVLYDVSRGEAVIVALSYGDGSPLARERYDLYCDEEETPVQSGYTDAEGRVVFLPGREAIWRVRIFTDDGHGADFNFEAGPSTTVPVELNKPLVERYAGLVAGVGIIFGVFGLLALFIRRRR